MNYNKKLLQAVLVFLNQKAWADTATAAVDAPQANSVLIIAVPVLIILLVLVFKLLATSKKSAVKPESSPADFDKAEESLSQKEGVNTAASEAPSGNKKTQKSAAVSEKPEISPLSRLAALEAEVEDEKSSNKKSGPSSDVSSSGEAKRTLKNKAVTVPPLAGRLADIDAAEKPPQPPQATTPEKKPAPAPVASAPVAPKAPEPVLAAEAPPVQPKEKLIFALEGDGKPYEAQGSVIRVGRKKDNQIYIPANEVSREHIEVTASKGLVYVTPLTETNTTRLNGRSIKEKQVIKPGDTLNLGGLDFIVVKARAV